MTDVHMQAVPAVGAFQRPAAPEVRLPGVLSDLGVVLTDRILLAPVLQSHA